MNFKGYAFVICAAVLPVLSTNHFAGVGASNSIGGTGAYTCRTQAQASCAYFCHGSLTYRATSGTLSPMMLETLDSAPFASLGSTVMLWIWPLQQLQQLE